MTRYAPAIGEDREFEDIWSRAKEGLEASGNPEGISDEDAREALAKALVKHGGKNYKATDTIPSEAHQFAEPASVREISIKPLPDAPYWWEDPDQALFIEDHILSRRAYGARMTGGLLITGPAGSGKTSGIPRTIARLNEKHGLSLRLLKMNCPTVTDPQKWFGRREIDKDGTRYEKSDFIIAVERGDVILLDEVKRLHPSIHNPIMSLLSDDESVHLSDLNVTIQRHPETVFIATTNEGAAFGGNHRMDYAMDERWPYRVERTFPPEAEEIKVVASNSGCDPDAASVLVDIAVKTRSLYATGDLRAPISTRTLVHAGLLAARGWTERESLSYTALGLYDSGADGMAGEKSERSQVRAIIEGRTGR